jgi:outer membrane protein OmpA-like peptidoglycan-associated protein
MNPIRLVTLPALTVLAAALAACSTVPADNALLDQARSDYHAAQADGQTLALAPSEMQQAGDALARAENAFAQREDTARVDQLAYLARQRTALAQQTADRKASEAAVASASAERDRLRLAVRTRQADSATRTAVVATIDAAAAQQQAVTAQQEASDANRRNQALEAELRALNAKPTDRGMVVTIGDLLFDTGRAELKSGGVRNVERLGSFLKEYPQRKALIEGYTDATGSESTNQTLSSRRAGAVMTALVNMGVDPGQLAAQGYGESRPVAGNDSATGRQMNRRVEIVLSDAQGVLTPH